MGTDVKTDLGNNVYVVGSTESFGASDYAIILIKYNNSGFIQWNTTWDKINYDFSYGLSLDSYNNSYIVGATKSLGESNGDACLIKFNCTGSLLWNKTWGGANEDLGYGIGIDSNNSIYITGRTKSYGDATGDIFLSKYLPFPDDFTLSHSAEYPDHDGNFTLNWSSSFDAMNYSIYRHDSYITEVNDSITDVIHGNTNQTYQIINSNYIFYKEILN